ncbi:MAG: hypothetical protein QNJ42_09970 [Crocosphaera sp.]|nr:hypothetical protein [Crocosphaera sp.]
MKELSTPSSPDHNNNDNAFKALPDVTEQLSEGRSDKESSTPTPSSSDPNKDDNAFKALINVTEQLSKGRGDNVAITGIIAVVIAFLAFIGTTGFVYFVYTDGNRQPNHIPQVSTTQPE